MYLVPLFQHLLQRRIYHTVPCRGRLAGKSHRYDFEPVISATITRYNMSMHEHLQHHNPAQNGSSDRSFGLVFTAFFLILALLPLLHGQGIRLWALGLAGAFLLTSLAAPKILMPLNRLWTRFGILLHHIVSPIALGVMFYGVVTPTGLIMRLVGKDPLRLRIDKSADSYWIERRPPGPAPDSLKLPF